MSAPDVTFRDAGLQPRVLRAWNRVGARLRRMGWDLPRLTPESIVGAARSQARLDDFGDDGWREPLDVLCDSIEREAQLSSFGRIALRGLLVGSLASRLRLIDWAKHHPEVREERIERPWVVVGLPRTGTTLLSLLLGLDPEMRPLLQWEASEPVPPPDLATHAEDPRIAESAKRFGQLENLNPAVRAMHPFGATLATECVTLFNFELRSLALETQAHMPSYGRWLEGASMAGAYDLHKLALQVLQSRYPTGAWSLKTPQHLWHLEDLRRTYPDARIVWTHRDPLKVVPSVASLNTALQRANSDHTDPLAVGREWDRKLHLAVSRGMAFDAAQTERDWCQHLQYADFVANPVESVDRLYTAFGTQVSPLHRRRMEAWMRERPQDVHGRHRYDGRDFGLDRDGLRERYAAYQERFAIPEERESRVR
ncbi:MAG: sulfotransferase [Myxococcota bacterium]